MDKPQTSQREQDTKALLDFLKSWNKMPNEEEIKTLIAAVLKYSQEIHGATKNETAKILAEIQNIGTQIYQKHDISLTQHKETLSNIQKDFLATLHKVVTDKLATLKDGKNGVAGEIGPPGKDGSPDTGVEIRNKLEHLTGEDRLDSSAIKGLDERLKKIEKTPIMSGWSSASGGKIVKSYDLSDSLNGVTKTFTLPSFWRIISVHLSSVPNILRPTIDYTSDATVPSITFTSQIDAASSLSTGQSLIIVYAEP